MESKEEKIDWYACALVDLLGQQETLKQLDSIRSIRKQSEEIDKVFQKTYGKVKKFRKLIANSRNYFNQLPKHECSDSPTIEHTIFSDLMVMHLSLSRNGSELDICRLKFMLLSLAETFLSMLEKDIPLRGGLDIGLGIVSENGQIYGRALSKAYELESKQAKSIRLVIGQELVDMLDEALSSDKHCRNAQFCRDLIVQDNDGLYILDYLSSKFQHLPSFMGLAKRAKKFLDNENSQLRRSGDYETTKKYVSAISYFEKRCIN